MICSARHVCCYLKHYWRAYTLPAQGKQASIPLDQARLLINQVAQLQDLSCASQNDIEPNSGLNERHRGLCLLDIFDESLICRC
jgi:hypothetical protein